MVGPAALRRRIVVTTAILVVLSAVGGGAMLTGWRPLPAYGIGWSDFSRGQVRQQPTVALADTTRDMNAWVNPATGTRGNQTAGVPLAATPLSAGASTNATKDEGRNAGWAGWNPKRNNGLVGTAGGGGYAHGVGLPPSGGGGSTSSRRPVASVSSAPREKAPKAPKSGGSGGNSRTVFVEHTTTVTELVTGVVTPALPTQVASADPGTGGSGGGPPMAANPEPSSLLLMGTGIAAVVGWSRRRRA